MRQRIVASVVLTGLVVLCGCGGSEVGSGGAGSQVSQAANSGNGSVTSRLLPPAPPGQPPRAVTSRVQTERAAGQAIDIRPRTTPLVVDLRSGWNMFSMPFVSTSLFNVSQPSNVLACYRYDASTGNYVEMSFANGSFNSNPFTGYWVYCSAPTQVSMNGEEQTQTTLSTNLSLGWNLVGTPFSVNVPTSQFQWDSGTLPNAFSNFLLWPGVLTYNGSAYAELGNPPIVLPAAQSQWIYAYAPGVLSRPVVSLAANRSFEQPIVPVGGFTDASPGDSTTIPGWTVAGQSNGNVAVINQAFVFRGTTISAQDGIQSLDLTGYSDITGASNVGISQQLTTETGKTYRVSFYIGNQVDPGGPGGTTSTVNVEINSVQVFSGTNSDGAGSSTMNWKQFSFTFTATGPATVITFRNGDAAADTSNGLDNVIITEEPGVGA